MILSLICLLGLFTTSMSSIVIPGSGHQMLDRPSRALIHLSADCIALFGAITLFHLSHSSFNNAKSLAYLHAGVADRASSDDAYWQMIGSFDCYDDYQAAYNIDLRSVDNSYADERYTWNWEDTLSRSRFVTLQKRSQQLSTFASFCVGAMVLNRLMAVIDIHTTVRNRRFKTFSSVSFSPVVSPTSSGMALYTTF